MLPRERLTIPNTLYVWGQLRRMPLLGYNIMKYRWREIARCNDMHLCDSWGCNEEFDTYMTSVWKDRNSRNMNYVGKSYTDKKKLT